MSSRTGGMCFKFGIFLRSSALQILFQGAPFSSNRRPGLSLIIIFWCLGLHISRE